MSERADQAEKQQATQGKKVFVGGLSWNTTEETITTYFTNLGARIDSVEIVRDSQNCSKGHGFIHFADMESYQKAEGKTHSIDGRIVNIRNCIMNKVPPVIKIFVGGISVDTTEKDLLDYFRNWGATNAYIVTNSTTGKSRNFGFLTFESEILGYKVLETVHLLKGRTVELRIAKPQKSTQKAKENAAQQGGSAGGKSNTNKTNTNNPNTIQSPHGNEKSSGGGQHQPSPYGGQHAGNFSKPYGGQQQGGGGGGGRGDSQSQVSPQPPQVNQPSHVGPSSHGAPNYFQGSPVGGYGHAQPGMMGNPNVNHYGLNPQASPYHNQYGHHNNPNANYGLSIGDFGIHSGHPSLNQHGHGMVNHQQYQPNVYSPQPQQSNTFHCKDVIMRQYCVITISHLGITYYNSQMTNIIRKMQLEDIEKFSYFLDTKVLTIYFKNGLGTWIFETLEGPEFERVLEFHLQARRYLNYNSGTGANTGDGSDLAGHGNVPDARGGDRGHVETAQRNDANPNEGANEANPKSEEVSSQLTRRKTVSDYVPKDPSSNKRGGKGVSRSKTYDNSAESSHSESDGRELFKVRSGSSPPRRDKNSHHGGSTTDSSSSVSSSSANTQERSGESNGSVGGVGEGGNLTNAGESVKSGANGGAGNGNGGNGNSGANAAAFLSPRTGTNSNETGSSFFSYLNDPLQSGPHADLSGQSSTESKKDGSTGKDDQSKKGKQGNVLKKSSESATSLLPAGLKLVIDGNGKKGTDRGSKSGGKKSSEGGNGEKDSTSSKQKKKSDGSAVDPNAGGKGKQDKPNPLSPRSRYMKGKERKKAMQQNVMNNQQMPLYSPQPHVYHNPQSYGHSSSYSDASSPRDSLLTAGSDSSMSPRDSLHSSPRNSNSNSNTSTNPNMARPAMGHLSPQQQAQLQALHIQQQQQMHNAIYGGMPPQHMGQQQLNPYLAPTQQGYFDNTGAYVPSYYMSSMMSQHQGMSHHHHQHNRQHQQKIHQQSMGGNTSGSNSNISLNNMGPTVYTAQGPVPMSYFATPQGMHHLNAVYTPEQAYHMGMEYQSPPPQQQKISPGASPHTSKRDKDGGKGGKNLKRGERGERGGEGVSSSGNANNAGLNNSGNSSSSNNASSNAISAGSANAGGKRSPNQTSPFNSNSPNPNRSPVTLTGMLATLKGSDSPPLTSPKLAQGSSSSSNLNININNANQPETPSGNGNHSPSSGGVLENQNAGSSGTGRLSSNNSLAAKFKRSTSPPIGGSASNAANAKQSASQPHRGSDSPPPSFLAGLEKYDDEVGHSTQHHANSSTSHGQILLPHGHQHPMANKQQFIGSGGGSGSEMPTDPRELQKLRQLEERFSNGSNFNFSEDSVDGQSFGDSSNRSSNSSTENFIDFVCVVHHDGEQRGSSSADSTVDQQ